MDRESVERLRFDRRLLSRREWVGSSDLDSHLESLPDVSDKMTTAAELEAEDEAAKAEGTPEAAPESAPSAGFGGPTSVGGGGFGGDGNSFGG